MKEQIEEMAKEMCEVCFSKPFCKVISANCPIAIRDAERLYNAGYRKQKEGEWVYKFTLDGDDFYECSVCGRQEVLNGLCNERNIAKHLPYCHCGAHMRGGENE